NVYFTTDSSSVRRIKPLLPGFSNQEIAIASDDGGELYVFDPTGRHLRTINTLTGATRYQFNYTPTGLLSSIVDGNGNTTFVERHPEGNPLAIVGPYGVRTTLGLDTNGFLAQVVNPANEAVALTYSPDGLLLTMTDRRQHTYEFQYDALGRLIRDEDPAHGF